MKIGLININRTLKFIFPGAVFFVYGVSFVFKEDSLTYSVKYYPLHSINPEELRNEINKKGPIDQIGNQRYAALRWNINWQWDKKNGQIDYKNTVIVPKAEIVLPELLNKDRFPQPFQKQWSSYLQKVIRHEKKHLSHVENATREIKEYLARVSPAEDYRSVNKAILKIIKKARRRDLNYDFETRNGLSEGIVLPGS